MFSMTISLIILSLSILGPGSVSQKLFLENIVIALVPSFIIQFQYNFIQVLGMTIPNTSIGYDNTSNKFAFLHGRVKVKVAVTIFGKTLSSL